VWSWKVPNEAAVEKIARKIRRWINVMGFEETATEKSESSLLMNWIELDY
jgi:hypothetical protein